MDQRRAGARGRARGSVTEAQPAPTAASRSTAASSCASTAARAWRSGSARSWAREPVTAAGRGARGGDRDRRRPVRLRDLGADERRRRRADAGSGERDRARRPQPASVAAEAPGAEEPRGVTADGAAARTADDRPGGAGADRVPGWPAGLSAHTVVLVTSSDRAAAAERGEAGPRQRARGGPDPLRPVRPRHRPLDRLLRPVHHARGRRSARPRSSPDRYPGAYPQLVQRSQ